MTTGARQAATVFAPASVGNVAVGFDILGHALDAAGDRITARRSEEPGVRVVAIRGTTTALPTEAAKNTAGAAVLELCREAQLPFGIDLEIDKGIPLGSGMGGSAASAVAAVVAANAILDEPLSRRSLFQYALAGEAVASGAVHTDNVAACLFGGLVFAFARPRLRLGRIPVPEGLRCVLVHPHCQIQTRDARQALAERAALRTYVEQSANLAGLITGCYAGDLEMIAGSLQDVLIEPQRARLIPGFPGVKQAALDAGALGCSISGSGPSLFAWCRAAAAEEIARAMVEAFAGASLESECWVSPIDASGAVVEEVQE